MSIEWIFPGATPEQKKRAHEAAMAVFNAARIQPEVASVAQSEMYLWHARNKRGPLPHHDSPRGAAIWKAAQIAALAATGAPPEALKQGHARVEYPDDHKAALLARLSRVLNWVDPDEKPSAPN